MDNEPQPAPIEIPPERIVESVFDIPLQENEFVFNPGHTYRISGVGLVNPENLWQAKEDKGKNRAVINLANIDPEQTTQIDLVIMMMGEELRQSSLTSNKSMAEFLELQINDPVVAEDKKAKAREFLARRLATDEKMTGQLRTKLQSANSFMTKITSRNEQSRYPQFDTTQKTIQERIAELPQT